MAQRYEYQDIDGHVILLFVHPAVDYGLILGLNIYIKPAFKPWNSLNVNKRKSISNLLLLMLFLGRDDKTRTCDLAPPRRVRYQLRYIPFLCVLCSRFLVCDAKV